MLSLCCLECRELLEFRPLRYLGFDLGKMARFKLESHIHNSPKVSEYVLQCFLHGLDMYQLVASTHRHPTNKV